MLSKIYLETTNICNLSCSFCPKTSRKKETVSIDNFKIILDKIKGKAKYLYLHLMGEPLMNDNIARMAQLAYEYGFCVMLTTNGTLLSQKGAFIYENNYIKKVSISLQSLDVNKKSDKDKTYYLSYLSDVAQFVRKCCQNHTVCSLRLWNIECENDTKNDFIIEELKKLFPDKWIKNRSGYKLFSSPKGENEVYLEFGNLFSWPTLDGEEKNVVSCYGLKDQIGILCDGTVVPCCLDYDGNIALGNIFEDTLDNILDSERAKNLLLSFQKRSPCEKLCQRCGDSERFK